MQQYFISRNNQKLGPFTIMELKSQKLFEKDMVWTNGYKEWQTISRFPELKEFIQITPPLTKKEANQKKLFDSIKGRIAFPIIIGFILALFAWTNGVKEESNTYIVKQYWEAHETGITQMMSRPFRMAFGSADEGDYYVIKDESLFIKIIFFSLLDLMLIYFLVVYLIRKLNDLDDAKS